MKVHVGVGQCKSGKTDADVALELGISTITSELSRDKMWSLPLQRLVFRMMLRWNRRFQDCSAV